MSNLKKETIVFDLDGTLIDTLQGITKALNVTLLSKGFVNKKDYYSYLETKTFIGKGSFNLLLNALNKLNIVLEEKELEELYSLFLINYEKYQYISLPFPSFKEVLEYLSKRYNLILYSNKPGGILQKLVDYTLKDVKDLFISIKGEVKEEYPLKPSKDYLVSLAKKYNLDILEFIIVGDSMVDLKLGENIKSKKTFIMNYGYGDYNEIVKYHDLKNVFILSNLNELKEML